MKKFKMGIVTLSLFCLTLIFSCGFSNIELMNDCEIQALNVSSENTNNFTVNSPSAYLVEYNTGTVIYEKNSEEKHQIASMVKIMTALLTFEAIDNGDLNFEKEIVISDNAAGMGGSQLFLDAGSKYKVSDLLKGVIVVSANDASVALAEEISGSEESFVTKMNEKAKQLNMENTFFVNATGLPASGQYSTAKDVSLMTRELLKHKEYYNYTKVWHEEFIHPSGRVTELANTNKLIRFYNGCDSGKTGFTNDAMFCLSASAMRNNMRVVSTVIGAKTSKERFGDVSAMFNYAFGSYENKLLLKSDDLIDNNIRIVKGKSDKINISAKNDIYIFGKKGEMKNVSLEIILPEEIKAPINKGEIVGKVAIKNGDNLLSEVDLLSMDNIDKESFMDIINRIFEKWNIKR